MPFEQERRQGALCVLFVVLKVGFLFVCLLVFKLTPIAKGIPEVPR